MELMESTSPSSYHAVLELDKKLHDLSAAINIYEDEQFNTTAASLEWNCILGATVRQASEYPLSDLFLSRNDVLTLFPISSVVDAPPIPRHGAPSTPRKPVRIDVFPIRARCPKLRLFSYPDCRAVPGKSARIDLEILGRVGLSSERRCKSLSVDVCVSWLRGVDFYYYPPALGNSRSPPPRSRYMPQVCCPARGAIWILRSVSWREEQITRGTRGWRW